MAFLQQTYSRFRFILLALATVCLVAFFFGRPIIFFVIESSLTDYLAAEHHLALSKIELGGSLVSDLRVAKIRATRTDKSAAVAELSIESLRADYSLLDLFQGMDAFLANTRITIDRGDLVLDLAAPGEDNAPATVMPQHLPRIVGHDLSLKLHHGDNALLFSGLDFSVDAVVPGQGQLLQLASKSVSLVPAGGKGAQASGSLSCWYRPESLNLKSIVIDGKEIPGTGQFLFAQNGTPDSFSLGLQVFGGELAASGTLGAQVSDLSLTLAALDLAQLTPLLPPSGYTLDGTVSGKAAARINSQGVSGTLDGTWQGTVSGEDIDLSCAAFLKDDALVLNRFDVGLAGNRLTITNGVLPLADLNEKRLSGAASVEHFAARLKNIPALWKIAGKGPDAVLLPANHFLELEGRIKEKRLVLTQGRFQSSRNSLILSHGSMDLPADDQSFATQKLTGTFQLALTDIREIASLAGLPEMGGSLHGTMGISGTLQAVEGHIRLQGEKLRYQGCLLGDLRIEAKADGKEVRVVSAQIRQGNDRVRFSGKYSLSRKAIESLEGEVAISELARYGAACKDIVGDLSGSLHGSITQGPDNRQHISLALRNGHFGALAIARGDLALDTEDWRNFACKEAGLETSQGSLSLSGHVAADISRQSITARMQQFILSRGGAMFAAEKPFAVTAAYGGNTSLVIDNMVLRSPVGSVFAGGKLSRQEEGNFQLRASGFKSGEWLKGLLAPGYDFKGLEFNLAIQGPLNRVRGSLVGSVAAFGSSHFVEPFVGSIDLAYSSEGLRLKKFAFNNAVGQQVSLSGLIPYDPFAEKSIPAGPLSLNGQIRLPDLAGVAAGPARQGTVSGELVGELNISGSWQQPVGRAKLRARNLTVPQLKGVLPPEPLNLDCTLALDGTRLQLTRCQFESASSSGTLSGEWRQLPSLASLVSQPPAELPGTLAVQGNLKMADIGWLVQESKAVRRLSGRLATTFSVSGHAAAPKLSGGLTLTDATLRFAKATLPSMDGVAVRAEFAGDTIQVRSMEGLLGGAPFHANGTIVMAGDDTRLDFAAKGKNLLFFRDADLKIRGDADLRLNGPARKLVLSGKLIVTDGRYTKNIDFLRLFKGTSRPRSDIGLQAFSLPDPPFRDMEFAIEVSATQPFLIRNNLAKGAVRPEFSLGGTGEIPVLVGRIFVDPVSISLPAGRLAIESGVITFPKNDPDRPTVDVTAKSKLAGYDIDMHLQGTADEPVITLSSQPALPDSDLLLLVLTGRPPLNGAGSGRRQVAGMNLAVYLGKGLLANWFGNGGAETDESVLERFELDIGREITSSGEDTVEAKFRLVEGLLLPGDRLFITSDRDVYDNYNVGVKIVFRFK